MPRIGRATIASTALLCVVAPVPAFALHTAPGACEAGLTVAGRVAVAIWVLSAALVLVSVAVDVARGRLWSLVALPLCAIASLIGVVLLFGRSPLCFS